MFSGLIKKGRYELIKEKLAAILSLISRAELARKLEVDNSLITYWMNGKRSIPLKYDEQFCKIFKELEKRFKEAQKNVLTIDDKKRERP